MTRVTNHMSPDVAHAIVAVLRGENPDMSALEPLWLTMLSRVVAAPNGTRLETLRGELVAAGFDPDRVMHEVTTTSPPLTDSKAHTAGAASSALWLLEGDFAAMFRRCDGAMSQDGVGFCKDDAKAAKPYKRYVNTGQRIPDSMRLPGVRLLFKYYAKQLSKDGRDLNATLAEEGLTIADVMPAGEASSQGYVPPAEGPWEPPLPLFDVEHGPPFPLEVLPAWQRAYVEAVADETQTVPDVAAMMVLGVVATATAKKFVVEVKRSWREHVCLYINVVLGVGEGKSPVVSAVIAPVLRYERDRRTEMAPKIREAEAIKRMLEHRLAAAEKAAAKPGAGVDEEFALKSIVREAAEHHVPVMPQVLFDDVTMARLGQAMSQQNGVAAVLSAEGTIFLNATEKYGEKGGAGNFDLLLKAYSGEQWKSGRILRGDDLIECPILTIGITTQPGVLRNLAKNPELLYKGLLPRFDFIVPPSMCGMRNTDPPSRPENLELEYAWRVRALLDLPLIEDDGEPKPRVLRLSVDAQSSFREFRGALEPSLGEHGRLGHIADWGNKLPGKVARYAALLHLADHAGGQAPSEVPGSTMQRACTIGRYLMEHAVVAFTMMGADPVVEQARFVLATLIRQGKPSVERQVLWQAVKDRKGIKKAPDLAKVLRVLNEHRYLVEQSVGTGSRAKQYVILNPEVAPKTPGTPKSPSERADEATDGDILGEKGDLGGVSEFEKNEAKEAQESAVGEPVEVFEL